MATQNRAQLLTKIATNLPDNDSGQITEAALRDVLTDVVDSALIPSTDGAQVPAAHTHTQSEIVGLSVALSGKANVDHTHAELHTHSNKSTLDKVGESGGAPTWNGGAWPGGGGGGDMNKSVYDSDNDGKVEQADQADSVPWSGVTGKPSSFTPTSHTHTQSDIEGLSTALAGKADTGHTHTELHTHSNKTVLDKIGESGGAPTWNGLAWPGGGGGGGGGSDIIAVLRPQDHAAPPTSPALLDTYDGIEQEIPCLAFDPVITKTARFFFPAVIDVNSLVVEVYWRSDTYPMGAVEWSCAVTKVGPASSGVDGSVTSAVPTDSTALAKATFNFNLSYHPHLISEGIFQLNLSRYPASSSDTSENDAHVLAIVVKKGGS